MRSSKLLQIVLDPENQPHQYSEKEAWDRAREIIARQKEVEEKLKSLIVPDDKAEELSVMDDVTDNRGDILSAGYKWGQHCLAKLLQEILCS